MNNACEVKIIETIKMMLSIVALGELPPFKSCVAYTFRGAF